MQTLFRMILLTTTILVGAWPTPLLRMVSPTRATAPGPLAIAPEPLPQGCGSVTPPGAAIAACCISGFVYIDGQMVADAEVSITSPRGDRVVLFTQVYSGTEVRPHYQLSLSAPPLALTTGETITLTARYSNHEQTLSYLVQPGSQQVDVVLPRQRSDDYLAHGQIWGQSDAGKLYMPFGIATDTNGLVYVVDRLNSRIQVFRSNGQFERQWGTLGSQPGQFAFPRGIAIDAQGNIYVGDTNNFRIQKFSRQGAYITHWGSAGTGDGQFQSIMRLVADRQGRIYVLDGDRIQVFAETGEHRATWQVKGSAVNQFLSISGMAVDSAGNVYLSGDDASGSRIQQYAPDGSVLARWDNLTSLGGFMNVMTVDSDGFIYFNDWDKNEIVKLSASGTEVSRWAIQQTATGAFFPVEMATDVQGNLYVLISGPDIVQRYATSTGALSAEWGGRSHADGQLIEPAAVAAAPDGSFYVADTGAARIQHFTAAGVWLQSWGSLGSSQFQLDHPGGIAVGADGSVYVADTGNNRIRQFTADGLFIAGWGSAGTGVGQLSAPTGIAVGADNTVYIADTGNNRIQRRLPNGTWNVWMSGAANFAAPEDVAVASNGTVYVADTGNRRIQQRMPNGQWTLWASPPNQDPGLYVPAGITSAPQDQIIVADRGTTTVHVFAATGGWRATWGGVGSGDALFQSVGDVAATASGLLAVVDTFDNNVSLFSTAVYTRPIATITHVSAPSLGENDTLTMMGMGQDSDETPAITAYRWTSDKDGVIGTVATLVRTAASLSPGSQHITLEVQDSEGTWSDPTGTTIFIAAPPQVTWTAMLYLAGDYGDRGKQFAAFNTALEALQTSLHNPAIRLVAQLDGPADGDTARIMIIPGNPPQVTRLDTIGEQAMDSPAALAAFLRWGQASFPAQHYYLALANHGQAIQGIGWDLTSDQQDDGAINNSAYLTGAELGQALRAEGVAPIDVIQLDACSMNLLEVAYELRPLTTVPPQTRLLIASQYLGWNYFAYNDYVTAISTADTPAQVAAHITATYAARAQADAVPYTIAAVDLGRADIVATAVDNLAAELAAYINNDGDRLNAITQVLTTSLQLESNGDYLNNELDEYVDLTNWASNVQHAVASPAVQQRAAELISELTGATPFVLAGNNRFGSGNLPSKYAEGAYIDLARSSGVSIFYPRRQDTVAFDSYVNNRLFAFTSTTRWADFLLAGIGSQAPVPLQPLPGPLSNPELPSSIRVMVPIIAR